MLRKLPRCVFLFLLTALFCLLPIHADGEASITLSSGESFSVVNTGSGSVPVSVSLPEGGSGYSYYATFYNADGSVNSCSYRTASLSSSLSAGREVVITALDDLVCTYPSSGVSAGRTSEPAVKTATVPAGSYLSAEAAEKTTVYFGNSSSYLCTTSSSGSVSYSIGTRSSCTVSAGCSLQLAFRDGSSHVCYWPARADLTYTVEDGAPYVEQSIPVGKTLKLQMPASGQKVSISTGGYYAHSVVDYVTADHSGISFNRRTTNSTATLSAGHTVELTPTDAAITFCYPTFYKDQFGMTAERYTGSPLTYETVAVGETFKVSMPATGQTLQVDLGGYYDHSYLDYVTEGLGSVSFARQNTSSYHPLKAGRTMELSPTKQAITFCYPTFYKTLFGMTTQVYNGTPLSYETVAIGETLKVTMPATGQNLQMDLGGYYDHSYVDYVTTDHSGVSYAYRNTSSYHILKPGHSMELCPTKQAITFCYPTFYKDRFGLTTQILDGSPITCEQIPVGYTMKATIPANSPNVWLSQLGYLHHTVVSYAANYSNMSFSKDSWSSSHALKSGYTLELMPISQTSTFFYPTLFKTQFGMTTQVYQGSPMVTYSLATADSLRLTWPADAAGNAPIGATRNLSYDLLTYPTGQSKQTCTYEEDTNGFSLKPGYTADVSSESASIDIHFPSALLDAGLVVEELYSQSVFYRETVKQNETLHLSRPKLPYTLNMSLTRDAGATWDYVRYASDGVTANYAGEDWNGGVTLKNDETADLTCLSESAVICVPRFWITDGLLVMEKSEAPAFSTLNLEMTAGEDVPSDEISLLGAVVESDSPTHSFQLTEESTLNSTSLIVSNLWYGLGTKVNYFRIDSASGELTSSGTCNAGNSLVLYRNQKLILQPVDGSLQVKFPQEHIKKGILMVDGKVQKDASLKLGAGFGPVSKVDKNDYVVMVVGRSSYKTPAIEGASVTINGVTKTTDHNGLALFENLPNGTYDIRVTRENYFDFAFTRTKDAENQLATVYLEKGTSSGMPYIMSVTGTFNDALHDLRNTTLTLNRRSAAELEAGYTADALSLDIKVNWNGHGAGTVTLYSPKKYLSEFTDKPVNFFRTKFYPAEDFGEASCYYLVAKAGDGTRSAVYTINLKTEGLVSDITKGVVDYFTNYFTIPALPEFISNVSAPFMEDSPFSFELDVLKGNKVLDDGNTMAFTFGLDKKAWTDSFEAYKELIHGDIDLSETDEAKALKKFFSDEFKADVNDLASSISGTNKNTADVKSKSKNLAEKYGARQVSVKTALSDAKSNWKELKPELSYSGYCQFKRVGSDWVLDEFCLNVTAAPDDDNLEKWLKRLTINKQGAIGYVPVYFTVGLTGSAEATGIVGLTSQCTELTLGGLEIGGSVGFDAEGGAGIIGVATLGVGGGASLNAGLDFDGVKISLDGFDADLPSAEVDITGSLEARLKVLGFTIAQANIAHKTWQLWPKTNEEAVNSLVALSFDNLDLSQPLLEDDLSYRKLDTVWLGDEAPITSFASFQQREERILLSGIDPDTEAVLTQFGDQQVLLWLSDNTQRADRDRSMLVYSVLDPELGSWSAPQPLWDNGFSDHLPVVQGNWVVWQKLNASVAGDSISAYDVAQVTEVAAAHWNGTGFDAPQYITENNVLDAQPVVASRGGQTSIVWTQNSANNLLGLEGTNCVLYRTLLENGSWSEAFTLTEGRKAITSLSAAYDDAGLRVAVNEEDDNLLDTIDDRSIVLFTVDSQNSAAEQTLVTGALRPQLVYLGDTLNLFYHQNDTIYHRSDLSASGTASITLDAGSIASDDYFVAGNSAGSAVLLWSTSSGSSVEVFGAYYDGQSWSADIQFSSGACRAVRPTALFSDENVLDLAYIRTAEVSEGTENSETATSVTTIGNLCTLQIVPACDLALGTISYDAGRVTAGEPLLLTFDVLNRGELAVDAVQAHIYTEDGSVDTTLVAEDSALEIGELKSLTASISIPSQLSYQPLTVDILPMRNEKVDLDLTEDDNRSSTFLGGSDLNLSPLQVIGVTPSNEKTESYQLWATVTNEGLAEGKNVSAFLRYGGIDGTVLAVQSLADLAVGERSLFSFTLDMDRAANTTVDPQFSITVACEDEQYEGNNISSLRLERTPYRATLIADTLTDHGDQTITVSGTLLNETDQSFSGTLFATAYNAEGRMIGTSLSQVIALPAGSSVPVSTPIQLSEDWLSGCTVKLLYLEETDLCPLVEHALYGA